MDTSSKHAILQEFLQEKKSNENDTDEMAASMLKSLTPEQLEAFELYLKQSEQGASSSQSSGKDYKKFLPEPGFILKTKTKSGSKIFINVCQSDEISQPKDITEDELIKLIEMNDLQDASFQFRIPMSLGEPHTELDNAGNSCIAYDVCIHTQFYKKIHDISSFMGFFMSVVLDGLESKYSVELDRNCKILKNKKFMGKITEQCIRAKSKPLIAEVQEPTSVEAKPVEKHGETPKYRITKELAENGVDVAFLVAEIELPKIISSKSLELDLGEDRIKLTSRSGLYYLNIYLPFNLIQEECGAQFDRKTKILTITMPVRKEN